MALGGRHNCIKLLDIVREGEVYCLVMEHVAATDYRKLLEVITPRDCKHYIYQVLKGLHFAHSQGIMHRDIKPQNVIIDHEHRKVQSKGCSCASSTGDWASFTCPKRTTTYESAAATSRGLSCWSTTSSTTTPWTSGRWES